MSKINVAYIDFLDISQMNNTQVTVSGNEMVLSPVVSEKSNCEKPTPTKFVKVEESIFDLKGEFERGELYMWLSDEYLVVPSETQLSILLDHKQCYRQVEIDWRDEVKKLGESALFHDGGDLFLIIDSNSDDFISMCHEVASLTEKPEDV